MSDEFPHWLRAALTEIDPPLAPLTVSRPAEGIANEVLLVETGRGAVVVKRYADVRVARREVAANSLMRANGVPAPVVLGVLPVDGGTVVVCKRLPGVTWNVALAGLAEPDIERRYGALGEVVARIHGVIGAGHGVVDAGDAGRSWQEVHRAEAAARLEAMAGTEFSDLVLPVGRFLDEHEDRLEGSVVPRLLHMDLHGGNILVHEGEISGIVDAEEALFGHNEYDLMRLDLAHFRGVPPGRKEAFMARYTAAIPLDTGSVNRARVYEVSRGLAWIASVIRNRGVYAAADWAVSAGAARRNIQALIAGD
jgi:aminoglycoside phosphotransferase (APT) family kinase protein